MGALNPLTAADHAELSEFLLRPPGVHVYLESRIATPPRQGLGFVYRHRSHVCGFAWFGAGRNLVLAGDEPAFLRALAALAHERERTWLMVVGPLSQVTDFLKAYHRLSKRRPRMDRSQGSYLQTRASLPPAREPGLHFATAEDVEELGLAAARMSAEDFEIDYWRIDLAAVRRGVAEKVSEGRSYLYREDGILAFKVDVAAESANGAQIEGVYTAEPYRCRGIATRCMSELGHRLLERHGFLSLHVASANTAACRAYEKAGYRRNAELRLAIFTSAR